MNHDDVISKLKDIHWPNPPSLWPLSPGYYLILMALLGMAFIVFNYIFNAKKRLLRRLITQEIMHIEAQFMADGDVALLQSSIAGLLKRLVFLKLPESHKDADLEQLTPVLHKILPDQATTRELILMVEKDRFTRLPSIDGETLLNLAKRQIKRCRI